MLRLSKNAINQYFIVRTKYSIEVASLLKKRQTDRQREIGSATKSDGRKVKPLSTVVKQKIGFYSFYFRLYFARRRGVGAYTTKNMPRQLKIFVVVTRVNIQCIYAHLLNLYVRYLPSVNK